MEVINTPKRIIERHGLTGRAIIIAAAKATAFALAFILPLVLVRKLDQFEFGLYKQAFQVLSSALLLLGLHVGMTAYYFMPREPEKKPQIVLNVLIFYLTVGASVALLFAVYPDWVTLVFNSDHLVPYVPMIGLAILLWLVSSSLETIAIANGDIRGASVLIVLVQLSKTVLLIAAGVAFGSVRAIVTAAVVQGALQCLLLFVYLRNRFGKFWRPFDASLFKAQLANALPFGIGGIVFVAQTDLHYYFVSHYFDAATFAIYAVGCFQLPLLVVLVDSVGSVLVPEIARLEKESDYQRIIRVWMNSMNKLALFFLPAYAFLFVMRHEFINVLFTESYAAAVPVFTINILSIPLYIVMTGQILRAFDECKYFRLKLYLTLLPITWAALYIGITTAGLEGAITAVVLIQALGVALTTVKITKVLGVTGEHLSHLAPVLRTAAIAAIAGLAAYLVKDAMPDKRAMPVLIVCSLVFCLVYTVGTVSSFRPGFAFGAFDFHRPAFVGLFVFTLFLYLRPNDLLPSFLGTFPMLKMIAIITPAVYLASRLGKGERLTIWPIELKMVLLIAALGLALAPLAASSKDSLTILSDTYLKVIIIFLLMINLITTRARLRALMVLVTAIGAIIAVGGIKRYLAGEFTVEDKGVGVRIEGIVGGMFGNPNDLATALDMLLPIAVVLGLMNRGVARAFYFGCAAVLAAGVVVTFSRGGFLGLIATCGVLLWHLGKQHRALAMTAGAVTLCVFFIAMPGGYGDRLTSIVQIEGDQTGSASFRLALLKRAAYVAAHNPILGVGMGNFHTYSIQERLAHNSYLEISAELGLAGLAAYLVLIFGPLRSLRRITDETEGLRYEQARWAINGRETYYLSVGLQAVFAAYIVCSFFSSIQYFWYIYYPVAYALALKALHAADRIEMAEATEQAWAFPAQVRVKAAGASAGAAAERGVLWKPYQKSNELPVK